jgi:hypothetical protein
MPRSTSQTSPRDGYLSLVALSLVVGEEDLVRGRGQLIIARNGILELPRKPEQPGKNFSFRRIRESPELLDATGG